MDDAREIIVIILDTLFLFNILFGAIIVFFERREPAVTWAWLMVIAFIPYIGFLLYLFIGQDGRKHRIFARKSRSDRENAEKIAAAGIPSLSGETFGGSEDLGPWAGIGKLCELSGGGALTDGNGARFFNSGEETFDAITADIASAKTYVHMLYYIFRGDSLGSRLIDALAAKAREGVEVKLLVDAMGCARTPKRFFRSLSDAGGRVEFFLPRHVVRVNYRNHRKICVMDGTVAYVGGLNVGDEYIGLSRRFGFWRDAHLRLEGPAARELEIRFILDWNFTAPAAEAIEPRERYFPSVPVVAGSKCQIIASGPDTRWPGIMHAYCKMIAEADRNIFIETPYFVPSDIMLTSLVSAALSGVDTRVIFPSFPDHPFVYWANLSFLGELLEAGVRCYRYRRGFIHSKLIVIDSAVVSVGTANMDVRSFKLNFEANAMIYDARIAKQIEAAFFADIRDSEEITAEWYANRPKMSKIKESISRLISPLL
ncbi:MAG: cardiolipin synthase [Clostridiales bacterium]|jgi:cardiolipin synthase|nr:cardiolipin synthase [Clostridiales bacterium]